MGVSGVGDSFGFGSGVIGDSRRTFVNSINDLYGELTFTAGSGVTITVSEGELTFGATNTGTVTSIAITAPDIFSVSGSPITTSGTLALTLATQAPNTFFAGPTGGGAATPAFRALGVSDGATGISSYTTGDILYASGVTTLSKLSDVAAGSYLRSGGVSTAPVWSTTTLPNSATTGDILYASGSNAYSNLAGVATGNSLISGGVGTAPSWGKIGLTTHVSGTLAATSGGTGQASYAVGDVLYASTTSALSRLAGVATGNSLISGGVNTAPSWGKIGLTTHVSGTLPATSGGTGQSSFTTGDIPYASSSSAISLLAGVATGNALISGGVGAAPSWGKIGMGTHVSGTLQIGNGGTGATTASNALTALGVVHAYKASDTARTSDTTPTIDPDLQFSMAANEVWHIRISAEFAVASATPGVRIGFSGPSTPTTLAWRSDQWANSLVVSTSVLNAYFTNIQTYTPGGASSHTVVIEAYITNGANAGAVGLYWAQVTSSADATTAKRGSTLIAHKMN